jgi:peptidoglycan/LPS O-acetylase OafA/YrhL
MMSPSILPPAERSRGPAAGPAAGGAPPLEIGSRVHVNALDGVRGLAFLMVYFYHFGFTKPFPLFRESTWTGVDLFLVLSGFLITGILLDTRGHLAYFKNFYARRTLRIFPLYYGVLLALLLLTPVLHIKWNIWELSYPFYASNIALHFRNIGQHSQFDIQHLWSLALEEQFYLLWPLIVWWIEDRRKLISVCGGIIAFSFIARSLLALGIPPMQHPFDVNYVMLPTRMDTLVAGSLLAVVIRSRDAPRWLLYIRRSFWIWLASILCLLGITRSAELHNPLVNTIGFSLVAALFASLVARVLVPASMFARVFQFRWLRSIGKYSYGMYVFHEMIRPWIPEIPFLGVWLERFVLARVLFFAGWLMAVYCLAWLSYNFFESRFTALKRYFPYHVE